MPKTVRKATAKKTNSKKKATRRYDYTDQHTFIIISGAGTAIILMVIFTMLRIM